MIRKAGCMRQQPSIKTNKQTNNKTLKVSKQIMYEVSRQTENYTFFSFSSDINKRMNPLLNKQFSLEGRTLLAMAYDGHRDKASCFIKIQEEYRERFTGRKVPLHLQSTIYRIRHNQTPNFTVHNHKASLSDAFSGRPREYPACARHAG